MQKSTSAVASVTALVLWIWSSWNHNHHVHNPNCDLWTSCHLWTLNKWELDPGDSPGASLLIQDQQNGCQVMMLQTCAGTRICLQPCYLKLWRFIEHHYQPYNIGEPQSDPAVSIAGREPTRAPRVHYCYSAPLQNGVCGKSYTFE